MLLPFTKMNGAGNDFVVIDNRALDRSLTTAQIATLCDRHRGVGADGVLAVEPAENGADVKFRYYNADGGEAEMCGNGARCFGRYTARLLPENPSQVSFETIAGNLSAKLIGSNVEVAMSDPFDLAIGTEVVVPGFDSTIHTINTGVPHTVSFVDDTAAIDVRRIGSEIRNHQHFAPAGTNANFAQVLEPGHLRIRTYERGVEDETLACGTGMVACAVLHHLLTGAPSPVRVDVAGGDTLEIGFESSGENRIHDVTLTGPADFVFDGEIEI